MDKIKIDIQGNGTLTADEIDVFFQLLDKYTEDSKIEGHATAEAAYQDAVDALHERFPQFTIEVLKQFVRFKDPEVLRVLLANAAHENPDGFTTDELLNITDIGTWFQGNTEITSFDELAKTSITSLSSSAFDGCINLYSVDLPITLTSILAGSNNHPFLNCPNLTSRINLDNIEFADNIFPHLDVQYYPNIQNLFLCGFNTYSGTCKALICAGTMPSFGNLGRRMNDMVLADFPRTISRCSVIHLASSGINTIIRASSVPSGYHYNLPHLFVPRDACDKYIQIGYSANAIGGEEWQTAMRQLAEQYAPTYNPSFDIDNADYSRAYIDYDIFGCDKSKAPYVLFDDLEVERVLLANATHADANTITHEELKNITSIGKMFTGNTDIVFADELEYTSLSRLADFEMFNGCTSLKSAKFPKTLISVPYMTFRDCRSLEYFEINDNCTGIGGWAFHSSGLKSITIPKSVVEIGNLSFACLHLSEFNYEGTMEEWNAVTLASNWKQNAPFTVVHCSDGDSTRLA